MAHHAPVQQLASCQEGTRPFDIVWADDFEFDQDDQPHGLHFLILNGFVFDFEIIMNLISEFSSFKKEKHEINNFPYF